jgi:hypothetical protein
MEMKTPAHEPDHPLASTIAMFKREDERKAATAAHKVASDESSCRLPIHMDLKGGVQVHISLCPRARATTLAVIHRHIRSELIKRPEASDPEAFPVNSPEGHLEIDILAEIFLQRAISYLNAPFSEMESRFADAVRFAYSSMTDGEINGLANRIRALA